MKIAYLLGSLNRGGTETLLLDVFRNAKQNKLDAIGIYRKTGVYEKEFLNTDVPMYKLAVDKHPFAFIFQLRKILLRNKVAIAHAQQPIDALYAWLACIGTSVKVILTFHGYDFTDKAFSLAILKFIIKRTHLNVYVSDTQGVYYQQKYKLNPTKQKVVYNGISFEKFMYSQRVTQSNALTKNEIQTLRQELNLKQDTLIMGTVGNFVPGRDHLTTCKFLNLLTREKIDFHFVFVGKKSESYPHYYDDCFSFCQQNQLLNHVTFLGSRDDVPALLPQLDAFVYSTDHDTFGIAVVEAMAVGIPVFVNDWEVMNEITDGGKYATLYKTKDVEDLLRHFLLFLQDSSLFKTKADKASVYARENYCIKKHIERLHHVYQTNKQVDK